MTLPHNIHPAHACVTLTAPQYNRVSDPVFDCACACCVHLSWVMHPFAQERAPPSHDNGEPRVSKPPSRGLRATVLLGRMCQSLPRGLCATGSVECMHHSKLWLSPIPPMRRGDERWFDRFVAGHAAVVYYWILVVTYMVSPKTSYQFSELVEGHATGQEGDAPVACRCHTSNF